MLFSPFPCYLVPLRPKYSPEHPIPKHPQPTFLPQCQWPSFTPIVCVCVCVCVRARARARAHIYIYIHYYNSIDSYQKASVEDGCGSNRNWRNSGFSQQWVFTMTCFALCVYVSYICTRISEKSGTWIVSQDAEHLRLKHGVIALWQGGTKNTMFLCGTGTRSPMI